MTEKRPFWREKSLAEMTGPEWESLCDGCARCCLNKLEDIDTNKIFYTDVRCKLLDGDTCRCKDYPNRQKHVSDCVKLTPEVVPTLGWLPPTCGYRLVHEGKDLPWWHPLVSGDPRTVVKAGVSVKGRTIGSEDDFPIEEQANRLVNWPARWPKTAK